MVEKLGAVTILLLMNPSPQCMEKLGTAITLFIMNPKREIEYHLPIGMSGVLSARLVMIVSVKVDHESQATINKIAFELDKLCF